MKKSALNNKLFSNSTSFIAIAIFIVVALSAVAVSVFQRINRGNVAPNAPESQPNAQVFTSDTCTLDINIGPAPTIECLKRAFQDEFDNTPGFYNLRQVIQTIQAGQVIVWAVDVTNSGTDTITISLTDVFTGNNLDSLTFMDSNCGANAYNSANRTLTCQLDDVVGNGGQARVIFRTRVANTTPLDTVITNSAALASGTLNATCMASVTVDELTSQKMCNEPCETDKECSDEDNQQCVDTGSGFFCRNVACEDDADCVCGSTPTPTPSPTPTPTPGTGGPTPTPTPTPSPTPFTDLELQKSVDDTTPTVGQNITYTVEVFNRGPEDDTNVTVQDVLPAELTYVSSNATRGTYNSSTNIWTIGNLAVNETVSLSITARVDEATTITNVAQVWTGTLPDVDSTPGNNNPDEDDQDSVTVTPDSPMTDLELQKSVDDTTPTVGQNVVFTVQVFNRGPFADTNVTVRDVLPSGLTYISSNATRGSYSATTDIWTIGNLAVNETVYLYLTVRVDSASTITNMAEVWTGTLPDVDSTPGNSETGEDDQDDVTLNPSKQPVQCGQTCVYNSDCADSNHICFEGVCRLASNPTSSTCAVATNTPAPTPQLPESGGTGSTFVIVATVITILVLAALGLLLLL